MPGRLFFYCSATAGILCSLAFSGSAVADPILFQAAGPNASTIQSGVDAYRNQLGTLNPNVAGSLLTGRREINWDGVPDAFSAPNNFPGNFFNVNSPRGVVFTTPGIGFQVSGAAPAPTVFTNINPTYGSLFAPFSPPKLFTPLGSTLTNVNFFIPGQTLAATVSGFGAVFSDVHRSDSSSIAFFDANGNSLGTFAVPASGVNQGLSFLGVFFNAGERVGSVSITSGNTPLGPNQAGTVDLVVLDDFIFAEPRIIPEPSSLTLLAVGLVGLIVVRRWPKAHCGLQI
jgi:hypothetical protein